MMRSINRLCTFFMHGTLSSISERLSKAPPLPQKGICMSELSWSTCSLCNTQAHTTPFHRGTILAPDTGYPSLQAPGPDPSPPVSGFFPDSLYQQPDPAPHGTRDVLPLVMADYEARMCYYAGPEQYGVPLRIDNLRDHLRDAYAEALDLPGYLKAAMVLWDEMRGAMQEIAHLAEQSQCSTELLRLKLQSIRNLAAPYQKA